MTILSSSPSLSHSPNVLPAVQSVLLNIKNALNMAISLTVEAVSNFVSRCWSGISNAGLFVDQLIIYIKQLEQYSYELLSKGQKMMDEIGKEAFFDHLYQIEQFLIGAMRDYPFVRETMERVIQGIIHTNKKVMRECTLGTL